MRRAGRPGSRTTCAERGPAIRVRLSISWLTLLGCGALPVWAAGAQDAAVRLPYVEDFETLAAGKPVGWTDASVGEVSVSFTAETRRPQAGKGAWRVDVPAWHAGVAAVQRAGIPLTNGAAYGVEVWLRGQDISVPVTVALRKKTPPYVVHFSRAFAVGPEWRRCVLEGRATTDDPDAALAISMPGSGVLFVDSLRVLPGGLPLEPEPTPPPAVKGNRVFNSSFELGTDGWTMPEKVALVQDAAPEGRQYARWLPNPFALEGRPFVARPNQRYTLSAYLRSQRPGAKARLQLVEVGNSVRAGQTFELTGEWKRYALTTTLPCDQYNRYYLSIGPADEQHGIDVDAVQVEEGGLTDYRPAAPLEVSPGLSRSMLFPRPDEILGVPVQVYAAGKTGETATVRYRLQGFYGETLAFGTQAVKPGLTHTEVPLRIRAPGSGTLRLVVEGLVDGQPVSSGEAVLTALPALDPTPRPDSFFGAHGSAGLPGEWHAPTVAARAGVRWWRLHDLSAYTQWAVAEPAQDRFTWYDAMVDGLRSRGLSILGVFARTPAWAGQDPGGTRTDPSAWPPARMADVSDYVRQVATHYRGRIDAYELWNEPWARASWAGTPEKYVEVAKTMARAAREADPAARLVGGSFYAPRPEFTDRVLGRSFLPIVDAISHHHYTEPQAVTYSYGGKDEVTQWRQSLRGKLDVAGGAKVEIWNTEGGTASPSFYSWLGAEEQARAAARTVAKTLILNKAGGVRRYFYYHVWQEMGSPRMFHWLYTNNWALLDYDGSGKPALAAFSACAQNLEGAAPAGRLETPELKAYAFARGGETVVALWSPVALTGPRELEVKIHPFRLSAMNLMNNVQGIAFGAASARLAVRNEPLYLHVRDTAPATVLKALKAAEWTSPANSTAAR